MIRLLALVTAALLTLTACGNGEVAEPPSLEGPVNDEGTATLDGDTLEMEMDDFYFEPTFVQASPGASVTVQLHNEGDARHTFTNEELGVDVVVDPGADGEAQLTLPSDGPVEFICRFHEAQGMRGAFYFAQ